MSREGNGCTHVNTHIEDRGDHTAIVCDACGTVTSTAPKN